MEGKAGWVHKETEQEAERRRANRDRGVGHDMVAHRVNAVQG